VKKQPRKCDFVHRREVLFEPPANDAWAEPITLDPETRRRFVRALAEMVVDGIVRQQQQHGQAK